MLYQFLFTVIKIHLEHSKGKPDTIFEGFL